MNNDFTDFIDDSVKIIRDRLAEINVSKRAQKCRYLIINSVWMISSSNSSFRYVLTRLTRNVLFIISCIRRSLSTSFWSFKEILVFKTFDVFVITISVFLTSIEFAYDDIFVNLLSNKWFMIVIELSSTISFLYTRSSSSSQNVIMKINEFDKFLKSEDKEEDKVK